MPFSRGEEQLPCGESPSTASERRHVDTSTRLFLSIIISSFGLGYFLYGKKQNRLIPTFAGIGLMVYPYFVKNLYLFLAVAVIGLIIPFVIAE